MSVDADEVRALAYEFARQLEHLREFRGVHYLGAGPVPVSAELVPVSTEQVDAPSVAAAEPAQPPTPVHAAIPDAAPIAAPTRPQPRPASDQTADIRGSGQSTYNQDSSQSQRSANASSAGPGSAPESAPRRAAAGRTAGQQWSAAKKLGYLRERSIGDCQRCPLAETRSNIVFGVGDPEADVMFIGEAPGAKEDQRGEPFVGPAGRLLNHWIERLGMAREDVFIANVVKCRPPNNRDPLPHEIDRCSPFLHAQIRAIEPRVLIALGRFAGCLLLGSDLKLHEMRGKVHRYREPKSGAELPLVVTYHPAYVLRREQEARGGRPGVNQPDRRGVITSEGKPDGPETAKVLDDLTRAVSLARARG